MTNILSDLRRLTEAVHAAGADIAPTYREYVQLAFAIATDCGEAGRSDFLMLCSLSAKYDVHAANKLFSNALKTNNNSVHIGTAFHLAELCNVRPRPAEKPRQDAPAGTLGTPGAPYPAASHTHAHGYYNRAEMPAEEFPEAPAASLPAEATDAGTANSGTACFGTTYPEAADPEAADEETCRGSEPLTPLPCFDNRTLWPAPLNEITARSPHLTPDKDISGDNLKDGIITRWDMTILPADFNSVLELTESLYRHATHILSFLPGTEISRRSNADRDALLQSMEREFTRSAFLMQAEATGIKPGTASTWLKRLVKHGMIESVDGKGTYRKPLPNGM